jgi:hypothetical protein|nr:MAG TPA: hypothetical protein [Caudoviricetes sp.]
MASSAIFPYQIEKATKVVKRYYFDGFPVISKDYAFNRLKHIMDDIEGFEPHHYDLYDVEEHFQKDGSRVYKGYLEVSYLSIERELYNFRY